MERVISQQIYQYLTSNNVLHRSQHGFMRGRSTCTNLLESINDWTLYLEAKNTTTAVAYIDFSKAFDTVSHNKRFHKLYCYGIRGDLLSWLQQVFLERTNQTRVGASLSASTELLSGIIQGSGIGPLLFLLLSPARR